MFMWVTAPKGQLYCEIKSDTYMTLVIIILILLLQTKKRYVGYKYESPEQSKPEYEAKGIETVRRDGCPAVAKVRFLWKNNFV